MQSHSWDKGGAILQEVTLTLGEVNAAQVKVVEDCWERGPQAIAHLRPMTLEGCVMRISDIIAYVGKDRQDALRAGAATEETFDDGLGGAYNAWATSAFVADIVQNSLGKPLLREKSEACQSGSEPYLQQ